MVLLVGLVVFLTLVVLLGAVAIDLVVVVGFFGAAGAFLGFGAVATAGVGAATEGVGEGSLVASAEEASSSGSDSGRVGAALPVVGVGSGVTALTAVPLSSELRVVSASPESANTAPPTISTESTAVTHRPALPERRWNSGGISISRRGRWGGNVSARWAWRAATASACSSGLKGVSSSMTIVFSLVGDDPAGGGATGGVYA